MHWLDLLLQKIARFPIAYAWDAAFRCRAQEILQFIHHDVNPRNIRSGGFMPENKAGIVMVGFCIKKKEKKESLFQCTERG